MRLLPSSEELFALCWSRLLELAVESRNIPSSLQVDDITERSPLPQYDGGYGDVYKAKWRGQEVAIKVSRVRGRDENVYKVTIRMFTYVVSKIVC